MSIIYCIRDFRFIGAPYLEALFAVLRAQARPFYAFLAGLPKEGFLHPLRLRLPEPSGTCRAPGRFRAPFGRKKTGCLIRHTLFSDTTFVIRENS